MASANLMDTPQLQGGVAMMCVSGMCVLFLGFFIGVQSEGKQGTCH